MRRGRDADGQRRHRNAPGPHDRQRQREERQYPGHRGIGDSDAARRMFTRSAITPKSGPATSVGDRLSAATSPTNPAEPVFSHASQDSVTLWTQIACTAKKTPTKKRENWGSRNAPPAIISKALSKCSWER
jgi:hypothetical protein